MLLKAKDLNYKEGKAMLLGKCCERVHNNYSVHDCGKPGKIIDDGKVYCGIHNPVRARERNAAHAEKRRIEKDKDDKEKVLRGCQAMVLATCKEWYKGACTGLLLEKYIKEMLIAEDKI